MDPVWWSSVKGERKNNSKIMSTVVEDGFEGQMRLFGEAGQASIAAARVAVVGVGGLGTHMVQQLSLLGVKKLGLVDAQEVKGTSRNRYIGLRYDDPIPGTLKVDV